MSLSSMYNGRGQQILALKKYHIFIPVVSTFQN